MIAKNAKGFRLWILVVADLRVATIFPGVRTVGARRSAAALNAYACRNVALADPYRSHCHWVCG